MCASKGTVPYKITEAAQNAAYQQLMASQYNSPDNYSLLQAFNDQTSAYALTRKAIDDNQYKAEYDQKLARYDQTPPKPCQPKEPVDPIEARFKGLILEEEKK